MITWTKICRSALLVLGVAVGSAGCFAPEDEDDEGCSKDLDCAGGRICVDGECQSAGGGPTGGSGGGDSGSCTATGLTCAANGECCNYREGDGYCVSGRCADACAVNSDCVSGCCASLEGGGRACAPTEICGRVCAPTGNSCTANGDCCNFLEGDGYCVSGRCADACVFNSDCVSGCCAQLVGGGFACAPASVCAG